MQTLYTKGQSFRWVRLLTLLLLLPLVGRAQYGANNAVVVRVGDGAATLSAAAAPVSLLEFTSAGGAPVSTLTLNNSATGLRLTTTGNSTTEGALFRTADGLQLSIAGYDAAAATAAVTGTGIGRSVATVDVSRTPTVQAAPATLSNNGNHRSAASAGTGFYSATSSGGVQYYTIPGTATQLSTTPTNVRVVGIYGGQLYVTSMSGSNVGLNTIGTGTPTTSGQTTTLIAQPGATTASSPYGFVLLDQSATETGFDVAYIADDRASAAGGVYKFSKVGGVWTANSFISSALGTRYLAARLTGTGVELYVATAGALYTFSDNSGYNTAPTVTFPTASIATAGTNYGFRGVAFAPVSANNPVPTITSLSPSSATAGDPAQTLTVNGTNFINTSVVSFNGTNRTTTFVSATQLTIQLTTADLANAGGFDVTVTNPAPGGGTTAISTFTVNPAPANNPVPTITSLSPSSVIAGASAQTLTVNGTGFISTSVVNFNNTARTTTFVSATQLTIQLTAGDQATAGGYDVKVTNPAPGGGTTAASTFTVNPVPAPTLTAISPSNPVGGATYVFTLTGTTFGTIANTTVNFNSTSVVPTSVTGGGTTLTVSLPLPAAGGTFPITVTTPNGTSGPQSLTVMAQPAGFFEPFEPASRGSYITAPAVALRTGSYNFIEALLGNTTPPGDRFNNTQSARVRGGGSITMGFDKPGGAGVVTISAALYATDAAASLTLEYSTDGGANFLAAPGSPVALTTTLTPYPFTLNVAGPVRLRIGTSNTVAQSNPRINVDDLQITNFTAAVCDAPTGLTPGSITSSSATVSFTASASAANGYTVTTTPATTTQQLAAGATSVSFSGLTPNTAYSVSIVSKCSATSTSSAATTSFTTLALAPTLAVSQSSTSYPSGGTAYSFGNQTVNTTSAAVAFTLTNSGPDALTISGVTTTGDYALSGTAPTTVAANSTATVSVTFTPTTTGTRTGTLVINSNATNGATYTVNLTGNGQAAALPDLTVSTGTSTSPTPIAGNYNNVTIATGGYAALAGSLTVAGTLTIQTGGGLLQGGLGQPCQLLTGTGNFNLQAGGTLAICDPAGISPTGVPTGAVLLTGTRTYSPLAQYIYTGNAAQITGLGLPTTVLALGVQNAAGVTLSQALSLTQGVNLNLGNLNTGGQTFTLLSSNAGTAGVVNASGVVVGTATMQRSINSSNALGYRHYSAPVSNTTFADLNTAGFSPVFNSAYNGSATPGTVTPFPTVFGYDQDRIATVTSNFSAFDKGWFSPAGSGSTMVVGKGYTVNAPNTALVDFVGTLNNGPVPSGTLNRGTDFAAGWHLLGNPYPSPLNWSTVSPPQRPGMDAAIYVFESAGQYGGSYRASVNGVGGNGNSPQPIVVAGQGYFVRVATGQASGQVNLDNPNRVTTFGPQPSFGRGTADTRPQVALTLQGASAADDAYVYFQAGATAGKDVEFDAAKLANSNGLNLTSLAGGESLAINGLPVLGTATVLVPLNVATPQAGSYSLKAGSLANMAGTTVTLVDALTSTRTVLAAGTTYAFSLSSTTATGRFALEFRPSGALATTAAQALSAQTQLFPNPASGSFRVQLPLLAGKTTVQAALLNALGQTVLNRTLNAAAGQAIDAEFDVRALAAGVYTLRLNVNGTPVVRKVMVE